MPQVDFDTLKVGNKFIYRNGRMDRVVVEVVKITKKFAYLSNNEKVYRETGLVVKRGKSEKIWGDIWPYEDLQVRRIDKMWKRLCIEVLKRHFKRPDVSIEGMQKVANLLKLGELE